MASSQPLRCLLRPTLPVGNMQTRSAIICAASFSTTTSFAAAVKAKKPAKQTPKPSRQSKRPAEGKKPNPGERKAFRKRIQLSNNSALSVQGTEAATAEKLVAAESAAKMLSIPDDVLDKLRALEAFKTTQSWNLFRKPHFLVREESIKLVKSLEESKGKKDAFKGILTGRKLSGKSMALLQAMTYALLDKWVVINIPEAQELTNAQTDYSPLPDTDPVQFTQPTYCLKLLQAIYKANKAVLEALPIQQDSSRLSNLGKDATLADLALSAKDSEYAWQTFTALWSELTLPGRPPILFALDGLSHISGLSKYRDPSFKPVHSHDLVLIGLFVSALSGKTKLPNGGAILAATSDSNSTRPVSQELVISQLEAIQAGQEAPKPDPYERRYDERVYEALKNSQVLRVDGVSKDEARALMEYWGASGFVRRALDWQTVSEKWALGGHGLVGEMERASLMTMRM